MCLHRCSATPDSAPLFQTNQTLCAGKGFSHLRPDFSQVINAHTLHWLQVAIFQEQRNSDLESATRVQVRHVSGIALEFAFKQSVSVQR
jgi:hypothetical protein